MFTTYLCSPGDVHVDIFASFVLHDEGWVWLLWKKWDLVLVKTTPCTLYRLAKVQNHKQGVNFGQILKYLLLLFPPWPWCPPLRCFWPNYWPCNKSRFDIIISGKGKRFGRRPTLFLIRLFFKCWAEFFRNWSSSSPSKKSRHARVNSPKATPSQGAQKLVCLSASIPFSTWSTEGLCPSSAAQQCVKRRATER